MLQEASGAATQVHGLDLVQALFCYSPVRVGQRPIGNRMALKSWLVARLGPCPPLARLCTRGVHGNRLFLGAVSSTVECTCH